MHPPPQDRPQHHGALLPRQHIHVTHVRFTMDAPWPETARNQWPPVRGVNRQSTTPQLFPSAARLVSVRAQPLDPADPPPLSRHAPPFGTASAPQTVHPAAYKHLRIVPFLPARNDASRLRYIAPVHHSIAHRITPLTPPPHPPLNSAPYTLLAPARNVCYRSHRPGLPPHNGSPEELPAHSPAQCQTETALFFK